MKSIKGNLLVIPKPLQDSSPQPAEVTGSANAAAYAAAVLPPPSWRLSKLLEIAGDRSPTGVVSPEPSPVKASPSERQLARARRYNQAQMLAETTSPTLDRDVHSELVDAETVQALQRDIQKYRKRGRTLAKKIEIVERQHAAVDHEIASLEEQCRACKENTRVRVLMSCAVCRAVAMVS